MGQSETGNVDAREDRTPRMLRTAVSEGVGLTQSCHQWIKGRADLQGGVALWGYVGEESYFSNLRVTPSSPLPIRNGGEAAGKWNVVVTTTDGRN